MSHATTRQRRSMPRHAAVTHPSARSWILGSLLLVVVAVAVAAFLRPDPDALGDPGRYPATPPAEWLPTATWSSPPLLEAVPPLLVGDGAVALITADRRLLMVDTADGQVTWSADLPEGDVRVPPARTRIDGRDVVAALVGDDLTWWRLDDGRRDELTLPADASVTFLGSSPLVALGGRQVAAVVDPESLTPVDVPEGAFGIAAHEDGQITAAGPAGWWHLGTGRTVSGPWEAPGVPPTVAGYTDGHLVLVRPGTPATVEIHADRTTDVRFVVGAPVVLPGDQVTWTPAPTGGWGILGRTLVDLHAGEIEDLGAWSTRTLTADRAYGHVDGQPVVVGPDIPRGLLGPAESTPAVITSSGALVFGPAGGEQAGVDPRRPETVLYHLPPRESAS